MSKGNELPLAEKVDIAEVYVHESLQATAADEGLAYSSGQSVVFNVQVPHNKIRSMLVCVLYGYEYVQTQQPPQYTRDVNVLFVRTSKTLVTLDDTTTTDEQSIKVECSLPSVCPSTFESKLLEIGDDVAEPQTLYKSENEPKPSLFQAFVRRVTSAKSSLSLKPKQVSPLQLTSGVRYRCRIGWIVDEHEAELDGAIANGTVHWIPQVGHHNNRGQDCDLDSLEAWELCPGLNVSNRNKNQVALLGLTSPIHFECSGRAYHPIITQNPIKSWFASCTCAEEDPSMLRNNEGGSPEWTEMPTRNEPLVVSSLSDNGPIEPFQRLTDIPYHFAIEKEVVVPSIVNYDAYVRVAVDRSVLLPGDYFPIHIGHCSRLTQVPVGDGGVDTVNLLQIVTIRPSQGAVPSDIPVSYSREFVLANSTISLLAKDQPPSIQWASVPFDVLPSMHGSLVHVDHFISLTLLYKNSFGKTEFVFKMPIQVGHLRRKGVKEDGIAGPSSREVIEYNFKKSLRKLGSDPEWVRQHLERKVFMQQDCDDCVLLMFCPMMCLLCDDV